MRESIMPKGSAIGIGRLSVDNPITGWRSEAVN